VIDRGKHNVLGVCVDAVDYDAAVDRIITAAQAGLPLSAAAVSVHGVMTAVSDADHRYRLNHIDLVVPDGQPVRWALNRLHGAQLKDRVYGPNLTLKLWAKAAALSIPIFQFWSCSDVLAALPAHLERAALESLVALAGSFSTALRMHLHPILERTQNTIVSGTFQ